MCTTESSLAKETVRYNSSTHLFVYTDNVFSCDIFHLSVRPISWIASRMRDTLQLLLASLFLRLNAHFTSKPGLAGFIAPKDDGSSGDNWSSRTC